MQSLRNEEIIRSLYDGVLDQEEWQKALDKLRCLTNSEQSTLLVWDRQIDEVLVADICRADTRLVDDYERHYACIDPTKERIGNYAPGEWYVDTHDMGVHAMRQNRFYQDFMRSHGLSSIMCCPMMEEGSIIAGLSFQAGLSRPCFDSEEINLLLPITAHLRRAIALRWRFRKLSQQAQLGIFLLDRFHMPIMVVDADGRIMLSNGDAESWLAGAYSQFTRTANISLQMKSIAKKICDPGAPVPVAGMKSCVDSERDACYLVGLPLKPDHPLARHWSKPVGVIIVQQASSKKTPWVGLFRELFGLSPAEARLLECLTEHESLYDAAMTLGVSKETARSHLKAIFQKTGVNKQAALSRLVVQLSQLH